VRDFTSGSILRQVITFSIPLIAGNFFLSAYNIINMIWVGRLLGHEAVAAISAAMPILFLFPSFLIGLSMAANILIAQAYGRKDMVLLGKVLSNSFSVMLIICLALTVAGIFLRDVLLGLVNAPPAIRPMASAFLGITFIGFLPGFFFNWMNGTLRGLGDSKTPLKILFLATLLNISLVPLLIAGPGPFPALGLTGAAWGSITANILAGIWGYRYIARKNPIFNIRKWDFTTDRLLVKKIFSIGIPASLQMIVVSLSGVFILSLVNKWGTEVTAAYGIGMQIDQLAFLPAMSIGIAVTSMAGQNLGAQLFERVEQATRIALFLSLAIAACFCALVYIFPYQIGSVFLKQAGANLVVLDHVVIYYRWIGFCYLGYAVMFTLQGVVRSSGDTVALLVLALISLVLVRVPLAYFLSQKAGFGENGIWMGILFSTFIGIILSYAYYKTGRWKRKQLMPHSPRPNSVPNPE